MRPRGHRTRRSRRAPLAASLLVAALVTGGCGGGDGDSGAAAPTTTPTTASTTAPAAAAAVPTASPGCEDGRDPAPTPSGHERVDLGSGGADRWYLRYVPASYDGTPRPLVVDLHGYQSGATLHATLSELDAVAEAEGFVLVTPQGTSDQPFWNAVPHADLPDDVAFVEAVVDDVGAALCIDASRVYVDGFSNGAFLASLLACRSADRVAAVATVAGLLLPEGCDPSRAVPILAVHGTEDRFVSIDGPPNPALAELTWNDQSARAFEDLPFGDVRDTAGRWADLQGCDTRPTRREVSATREQTTYEGCDDGSTVQLHVIEGAGHTWPSSAFAEASASILGPATDELEASAAIWSFFEDHRLPPAG